MQMKIKKRTSDAGTSKVRENALISPYLKHVYYITLLMAITTIIAGWHIDGVWDGIITILLGIATIWMSFLTIGGFKNDRI